MRSNERTRARPRATLLYVLGAVVGAALIAAPPALADPQPLQPTPTMRPIDPQLVQDQDVMTWDDYRPIQNTSWADPDGVPTTRGLRILLVAVDFNDQPFVVTQPKFSDPFGNPQIDPIAREDVPQFYADYFLEPSTLNRGHTIHEYWMEQSRGQLGVTTIDVAGPYRMPKFLYQYGLNEFNQNAAASNACPAQTTATGAQTATTSLAVGTTDFFYAGDVISIQGSGTRTVGAVADATHLTLTAPATVADGARVHDCAFNLDTDVNAAFRADLGCTGNCGYDVVLRIYAGYDETSIWQEFGEMKFQTQDDVPDEWGNPNPLLPNWAITRYVPWTSWRAAAQQWGLSSIRQGESSGTITHEMGHFFFSIGDNNNNPFSQPYHRVGSAPWDMMDRGSFNGPGGHHMRWVVPANMGAWMPAGLMVRNKMTAGILPEENLLRLNRLGLAASGPVVAKVAARAVDPGPEGTSGIRIALDGPAPIDRTPACSTSTDPFCHGNTGWNDFTVEVAQRIGYDSYTPDNGVLIAKNKNNGSNTCGYSCFNWVIDANPQDMNMVDYYKPDGTPVMRTIADHRQLNDAAFHAGVGSGSEYEWVDPYNRLHFYVIDRLVGSDGVIDYQVGIRSLDGSGPQARGVALANGKVGKRTRAGWNDCTFRLTNTGEAAATPADAHPEDAERFLRNDIYRLSASVEGEGWEASLYNALATAKFGRAVDVPVFVTRGATGSGQAVITLTAVSEGDPSKTATATCNVDTGDLG